MSKINPAELSKKVEDILAEAQRASKVPEQLIEAIREMDKDLISFRRYSFVCPSCNSDTYIEEVLQSVIKKSMVESIDVIDDRGKQFLAMEYGHEDTEDGDYDSAVYRCNICHHILSNEDLVKVAQTESEIQEGMIPVTISKTEYGHKVMVPGNLTEKEVYKYIETLINEGKIPGFNPDIEWWVDQ